MEFGRTDLNMKYQNFLASLDDDAIRKTWWERFLKAESSAKACVGTWELGKLDFVVTSDKTCWCSDGTISIRNDDLAKGALYHELFHPVLHNSPFKKRAEANSIDYRLYCECLCNAFEYFMERSSGPIDGDWTVRMANWKSKTWAQIIAESTCLSYDMTCGLPALEFIKTCVNFDGFKKLFADLNSKSS